jgi:mannose-6-phosphate isomerase
MDPVLLPANQPADRFYLGGARIAEFRGEPGHHPRTPEDWIASTSTVRGHDATGRTVLPDGTSLATAV